MKGDIRRENNDIIGFVMPMLQVIEPASLTVREKVDIFRQIRNVVPLLHDQFKIIHGDIKLSNLLLDGTVVKLCDFGTSAWVSEVVYPTTILIRWSSPYRLKSTDEAPRKLVPEEDFYSSGIAVWELFVGEPPFGPYISDDNEFELWDKIVDGLKVDVERIDLEEPRLYVKECLSIECLNN